MSSDLSGWSPDDSDEHGRGMAGPGKSPSAVPSMAHSSQDREASRSSWFGSDDRDACLSAQEMSQMGNETTEWETEVDGKRLSVSASDCTRLLSRGGKLRVETGGGSGTGLDWTGLDWTGLDPGTGKVRVRITLGG